MLTSPAVRDDLLAVVQVGADWAAVQRPGPVRPWLQVVVDRRTDQQPATGTTTIRGWVRFGVRGGNGRGGKGKDVSGSSEASHNCILHEARSSRWPIRRRPLPYLAFASAVRSSGVGVPGGALRPLRVPERPNRRSAASGRRYPTINGPPTPSPSRPSLLPVLARIDISHPLGKKKEKKKRLATAFPRG